MLLIQQHPATGYAPRTCTNAQAADLTVAFAVDFSTPGELLTKKMAGHRYVDIPYGMDPTEAARRLYKALRFHQARSLNVAGNGLYTLIQGGWSQESTNVWVFEVISTAHRHWPIEEIRSGGQTGVDTAGLVSGLVLELKTTGLYPQGFVQRGADNVDRMMDPNELRRRIDLWAAQISVVGLPAQTA